MIINPIIPIWLMIILCGVFLIFKRKGAFHFIRQIVIVVLLFLINLRIMVPDPDAETVQKKVDVLFVVDNTISMQALDYGTDNSTRMSAVRTDCAYIMEKLPGAQFSVVSFADTRAQLLLPYTIDTTNVMWTLNSLKGQASLYATGSDFESVLTYMEELLDRENDHLQIVFFISDGEMTQTHIYELESHPALKDYIDCGAVLGYGTEKGGKMYAPAFSSDEELEELYYYDENYDRQPAFSCIDEENLQTIASDMGVDYVHMTETSQIDATINKVLKEIETAGDSMEEDTIAGYSDTFFYLLIPFLPLLIIDFIYYSRKVIL